ncbi:MAG TPA: hypothetical protein VFC33_13585 [Acidimicrobiia bacterium]|nr:hypothetical protein [Acidimicrobiia bacterium]
MGITRMERVDRGASTAVLWIAVGAAIVALAAAVPLVLASHYGALGIPRSDDWSYLLVQFRFVDHGTVRLNNWVSMTLIGQVLLGAPVALLSDHSITAMQVFTAVLGLIGLAAVLRAGRQTVGSRWVGAFVAVMVAAGPLWGPLAASFMTDVPAFAFGMLALVVGIDALRRRPVSIPLVAASVALGFVAFSIRQYAVVAPVAVIVSAAWVLAHEHDRKRLRVLAVLSAVFVVLAIALFVWWRNLPESLALAPVFPNGHSIKGLVIKGTDLWRLVGLLCAPAVVLAGPARLVRRAWRSSARLTGWLTVLCALLLAAIYFHVPKRPFVGNYVSRDGVLTTDVMTGTRPNVVPRAVFDLMVLVGSLAAILLVLALVPALMEGGRRLRRRDLAPPGPAVLVFGTTVLGFALAYAVALVTDLPMYDRYALPVVPLVALLVLHAGRAARTEGARASSEDVGAARGGRFVTTTAVAAWSGVALVALLVVGLAYTADSASFDGARWRAATALTHRGYTPLQIDGGFEWNSYHFGGAPSTVRAPNSATSAKRKPSARERRLHYCVKLSMGEARPGTRPIGSQPYDAPTRAPSRIVEAVTRPCVPSG